MMRPWWMSGVPFACQPDCGKCCDEPGGIVYLRPIDAEALAHIMKWKLKNGLRGIVGKHLMADTS